MTESVYLLLTQSSLPEAINVKNALSRMAQIPGVVDVARSTIKNPPRVKVETAIRQTEGAIGFYQSDLFKLVSTEADRAALREQRTADRVGAATALGVSQGSMSCRAPATTGGSGRSYSPQARARAGRGAFRGRSPGGSRARSSAR